MPPFSLMSGGAGPRLSAISLIIISLLDYIVREATLADADALVRQRIAMFTDMSVPLDTDALARVFRAWLAETMPSGVYRAWLVEDARGEAVAGGGLTVLPWPPGPRYLGDRLAFVYNVYVDPARRRQGLGRLVMETIHRFCREAGIASIALNASRDGLPLYEALGYRVSPNPMMFFAVASKQQV
jgi:GNAT superfamily N-acetyltransferase